MADFLPVTPQELLKAGVKQPDFVYNPKVTALPSSLSPTGIPPEIFNDSESPVWHFLSQEAISTPWWHITRRQNAGEAATCIPPAERQDFGLTVLSSRIAG